MTTYNTQKLKTSVIEFKSALEYDEIDNAINQLKKTQKLFNAELGAQHPFQAIILYQFHMIYDEIGDDENSEQSIIKAIEMINSNITSKEILDDVEKMYVTLFEEGEDGDLKVKDVHLDGPYEGITKPGVVETIFDDMIQLFYSEEKFVEAEEYALKALAFFDKVKDEKFDQEKVSYIKFLLGDVKSNLKKYKEAEDLMKENIAYYESKEKKNYELISKTYCRIAEVYIDQGKFDQGIEIMKTVLESLKSYQNEAEKREIDEAISMVLSGLGQIYFEKEQFNLALDTWKESLVLVEKYDGETATAEEYDDHEGHHTIECVDDECAGCCDDECKPIDRNLEVKFVLYEDLTNVCYELGLVEEAKNYRKLIEKPDAPTISCAQSKYLLTNDYHFDFNEENPDTTNLNISLMLKKIYKTLDDGTIDELTKLEEGSLLDFVVHFADGDLLLSTINIENRKLFDYSFEFLFPPRAQLETFVDLSVNIYKNSERGSPIAVHRQSLFFHFDNDEDFLDMDLDDDQLQNISKLMMMYGGQIYEEGYDDNNVDEDDDQ
jgi:tetratricopeptide (TPR) repeat protein